MTILVLCESRNLFKYSWFFSDWETYSLFINHKDNLLLSKAIIMCLCSVTDILMQRYPVIGTRAMPDFSINIRSHCYYNVKHIQENLRKALYFCLTWSTFNSTLSIFHLPFSNTLGFIFYLPLYVLVMIKLDYIRCWNIAFSFDIIIFSRVYFNVLYHTKILEKSHMFSDTLYNTVECRNFYIT